jgi:HD-GYP domain-containing protein (c-di-GMP phosphodiesterase class II)
MKKKIPVSDLKFGMYVYELDRPWTETPFVFQGFVLDRDEQIETLRKHCQEVYVDMERSELSDAPRAGGEAPALTGIARVQYVDKVSVDEEIPVARHTYVASETAVTSAFEAIKGGEQLAAEEVHGAAKNMTESIVRNPDAMVLFTALTERGGYFLNRALQVSVYMISFARFLGMEQVDIERAGMVGLLQDVGMLQVPDEVVQKSGPLSGEERTFVNAHLERAVKKLSEMHGLPATITDLVALHHERYDGSGYPRGLKGGAIDTIGAIAGIVDVFSALTSKRAYAEPIAPSNALGLLHKWRGQQFHPTLVEQFIRCIGIYPVGSVVEMNTGEVGIVISQNPAKRLQPRVMVVRDAKGQNLRPQKLLDLSRSPKAGTDQVYQIRRTLEYGRAGVSHKDLVF